MAAGNLAAMEPARDRREHTTKRRTDLPGSTRRNGAALDRRECGFQITLTDLDTVAAMEPADRRERMRVLLGAEIPIHTAMRPAVDRREHGSGDTGPVTCADRSLRERPAVYGAEACSMDLSRCKKRPLACMRAVPGFRVTTSALAGRTGYGASGG
jgi:hypothetical protein